MARGWESKSVEAQQAEASDRSAQPRKKISREAAAHQRDRESLELARRSVIQKLECSHNPRHQKLLQDSLAELDQRLKALPE